MSIHVVDEATNLLGPLSPYARARLTAVLVDPNARTWEAAHTMVINDDLLTLWQAVHAVDPSFPWRRKLDEPWPRIPDQLTLRRAMRYARTGEK